MITKAVIKDYVAKKCPYLVSLELEDTSLIGLFKTYLDLKDKYKELVAMEKEEKEESEDYEDFDFMETLREYPHLKNEIKKFQRKRKMNIVDDLVEKYEDNQLLSKLSRRYFELRFGKEKCARCDVDGAGAELLLQDAIIENTNKYLKDKNIKVIFEGQIEYENLRARFDILIRNDDGSFTLVEVKGTNTVFSHPKIDGEVDESIDSKIKDSYLYDLLFQYYVYKKAGLNISHVGYMYTNKHYELHKLTYPVCDEELVELFLLKYTMNLKDNPISLKEYFDTNRYIYDDKGKKVEREKIEDIIDQINEIAKQKNIKPKKSYLCCKGPACPFMDYCFKDAFEPNSIFKLTRWNMYGGYWSWSKSYIDDGIEHISDIDLENSKYQMFGKEHKRNCAYTQILYQQGKIKEKYLIDMQQMKTIIHRDYLNDDIKYLIFFDFESFMYPIPLVEHLVPWKQVVSQYSMHIVKKGYDLTKHDFDKGRGGDVSHYEFIADPDETGFTNPSIPLYTKLKEQLIDAGVDPYANNYRVVVFNKSFEKTRMKEFYEDFPNIADDDLIKFVMNFRENVVDLLDFFTNGAMYCTDFNGRGSLKVVQPTLAADENVIEFYKNLPFDFTYSLDYHKDDKCLVYNGGICLDLYKALVVRSHLGEQNKGPSTKRLLAEALAYCKIDSWGTVIIYDVIKNFYLGKLKLDAKIV